MARTTRTAATKKTHLGAFGSSKTIEPRYQFGTAEEIANRVATGYRTGGTPPENKVPNFVQIRPGMTGKSANDPAPNSFGSRDLKFGNNRGYF
jgi:hypothetical protein